MPFISIEGIDGSGKTTQVNSISKILKERNLNVLQTKEPDGGWIGAEIRSILTQDRGSPFSPQEEMLLIFAARFNHVQCVIKPALEYSNWVITDRFVDSTFAFQVFETGVSEASFNTLKDEVIRGVMPDFTFILDISEEMALFRRASRSEIDPAENNRDFSRIRKGLLESAKREPERCHIIDASLPSSKVTEQIIAIIDNQPNNLSIS